MNCISTKLKKSSSDGLNSGKAVILHLSDKNSSGDEIANVNFFTMISHTYFKKKQKENLLRLTN